MTSESRARPHRLTFRELLILVASGTGSADQVSYLSQIFEWYFTRTRDLLVALLAAAAALAIAVGGRDPDLWVGIVLVTLEVTLIGSYFWVRRSLKPLHREYLCCLALMRRLNRFRAPLSAALEDVAGQPWPEPSTYLPWYGSLVGGGRQVARRLQEQDAQSRAVTLGDDPTPPMLGKYLFDVLSRVPMDEYERRRAVRITVDEIIRRAAQPQQP